jgi:hypothetical protein
MAMRSEAIDPAPDLQARIGEIHQQGHGEAARPKVVQALSVVVRIQGSDRLDFHQHGIFHQKVSDVSTDGDTVVFNSDGDLLPDHEAGLRQLVRQGIFVNLFKESGAERIGDGESAPNDTLGNFIDGLNPTPGTRKLSTPRFCLHRHFDRKRQTPAVAINSDAAWHKGHSRHQRHQKLPF